MRLPRRKGSKLCRIKIARLGFLDLNRAHKIFSKQLLLRPRLPQIDAPVEVLELDFLTAPIDGSTDGFVNLDPVLATFTAIILHRLLRSVGLEVDVKVAEDLTVVRTQADIGFQVRRKGHVNGAI